MALATFCVVGQYQRVMLTRAAPGAVGIAAGPSRSTRSTQLAAPRAGVVAVISADTCRAPRRRRRGGHLCRGNPRRRGGRDDRRTDANRLCGASHGRAVAVGVTLSGIGDAIYYVMGEIQGSLSDLSIADAFWVTSYIAVAIGLSSLVVGSGSRRVDFDGLIDIGSFAVLAVIVVSQLSVVRDTLADTSSPLLARLTWTAYPMLDAALLGVATQAIVSKRMRNLRGLYLSARSRSVARLGLRLSVPQRQDGVTGWLDLGWMIGAASIAVSAWPSTAPQSRPSEPVAVDRMGDARIAITLLPLLVPASIEIWAHTRGDDPAPVPLFVAHAARRSGIRPLGRLVRARNRQEEALDAKTRFYTALAENSSDAVIVVGEGWTHSQRRPQSGRDARSTGRGDDRPGCNRPAPTGRSRCRARPCWSDGGR